MLAKQIWLTSKICFFGYPRRKFVFFVFHTKRTPAVSAIFWQKLRFQLWSWIRYRWEMQSIESAESRQLTFSRRSRRQAYVADKVNQLFVSDAVNLQCVHVLSRSPGNKHVLIIKEFELHKMIAPSNQTYYATSEYV